MNPEQGGEKIKRINTDEFQNILISNGQVKISEELSVLAQEKDRGRFDTLFSDYSEARMHEFRLRIMADILHKEIENVNKKINSLDRPQIDVQHDLQISRDAIQNEIDEYEEILGSLVSEIQEMEDDNTLNNEFQEFKKLIEEKEERMLRQSIVPDKNDLSKN